MANAASNQDLKDYGEVINLNKSDLKRLTPFGWGVFYGLVDVNTGNVQMLVIPDLAQSTAEATFSLLKLDVDMGVLDAEATAEVHVAFVGEIDKKNKVTLTGAIYVRSSEDVTDETRRAVRRAFVDPSALNDHIFTGSIIDIDSYRTTTKKASEKSSAKKAPAKKAAAAKKAPAKAAAKTPPSKTPPTKKAAATKAAPTAAKKAPAKKAAASKKTPAKKTPPMKSA